MLILGFIYSLMVNATSTGWGTLHSQPVLPLKIAESVVWNHAINRVLFSQTMYDGVHISITKGFGSAG